jgi:hypothetical protein
MCVVRKYSYFVLVWARSYLQIIKARAVLRTQRTRLASKANLRYNSAVWRFVKQTHSLVKSGLSTDAQLFNAKSDHLTT